MKIVETDVLVLGSGIAGISAAIYAAKSNANVILASSVQIFSGSSFYPGTWGLGLIGPEDENDVENLINTIKDLGKGMTNAAMVNTFVKNLNPTIDEFEKLGIKLAHPTVGTEKEKEYIPCFDYKNRRWRGLTKENLKATLPQILETLNITIMPFFEAIQLISQNNQVYGAVGIKDLDQLLMIKAKATILATGGLSGLYKRYLTTSDVTGCGQAMALNVGSSAVNLEFTQMMLGFVSPGAKTVHNEKTFKASRFYNEDKKPFLEKTLPNEISLQQVLASRSLHGPFSSETISKYLDIGLYSQILKQSKKSITLKYDQSALNMEADFVKTYFDWLKKEKHIDISDDIETAPYMHASNGGIKINEKAETGVLGLYAAGEVTGGMHGADRIGGLSTANGMVFGKIAGNNASQFIIDNVIDLKEVDYKFIPKYFNNAKNNIAKMRNIMDENTFLIRSEENLNKTLFDLPKLLVPTNSENSIINLRDSYQLYNGIISAMALVSVLKARKESRGSHYRSDYLNHDSNLAFPFNIKIKENYKKLDETMFEIQIVKDDQKSKEVR